MERARRLPEPDARVLEALAAFERGDPALASRLLRGIPDERGVDRLLEPVLAYLMRGLRTRLPAQ